MMLQTYGSREFGPIGHGENLQNPVQNLIFSSPSKLQILPSTFDSRFLLGINFQRNYRTSQREKFSLHCTSHTSWRFCPTVRIVNTQKLNLKEIKVFLGFKLNCCSETVALSKKKNVVKGRKKSYGGVLPSILRSLESENDVEKALESQYGKLNAKEITVILKEQGSWEKVLSVFKWIKSQKNYVPNVIHYNVVLRALGMAGRWDELRLCWIEMAKDGVFATNNTYSMLVDVYGKAGLVKEALLWIKHMKLRGMYPDEVTMSTVLRVLKDAGEFDKADRFYKGWCSGNVELDDLDLDSMEKLVPKMGSEPVSLKQFILTELFRTGRRHEPTYDGSFSRGETSARKPQLTATYNTLIDLYGKAGRLKDAAAVFAEMMSSGVAVDTITFNTMIFISGTYGHLSEAEALFDKMEERGITPDTKTYNILFSLYANAGNIEAALGISSKIKKVGLYPDAVTRRALLRFLCERRMVHEVVAVIEEIERSGKLLDQHSLPGIIKMFINEGLNEKANMLFKKCQLSGGLTSKTYAAIVDVYAEKGLWAEAEAVFFSKAGSFERRTEAVEYNVMIKAYGKSGLHDKAYTLFKRMKNHGIWPDECTFNTLIQMSAGSGLVDQAKELLAEMQAAKHEPSCQTFSAVIANYARAGRLTDAADTFQEMLKAGVNPNEVVYGALVDGFAEAGDFEEAISYYHKMEESGIPANLIVLTSMIKAYSKIGSVEGAKQLYEKMKKLEGGPDIVAANSMLNLYAEHGVVSEAEVIYNELKDKGWADGVTFATMMYVYKNMGMLDEAIAIAEEMKASGLVRDSVTFNKVMACYATNNQLLVCGELLHEMIDQNLLLDRGTFKVLFTVLKKGDFPTEAVKQLESSYYEGKPYAKQAVIACVFAVVGLHALAVESCEVLIKADKTFGTLAYNTVIYVYGASGKSEEALKIFMKMQDVGLEPDIVTFIHLVKCYGRAGMVEGIKRIYGQLRYEIVEPNESLYRAVIDAYEIANRHDLAELVSQEMRFTFEAQEASDPEIEDFSDENP